MTNGGRSVAARFPGFETLIETRCGADEEFRILCDDLADAEAALHRLEAMEPLESEDRVEEYRLLVESLSAELGAVIGAGRIIPFVRKRERK